jgi:hypothetical protein
VARLLSPRPLVVAAVVVALALGACAKDEDVTKADFKADLIERTKDSDDEPVLSDDVATCLTDAIFDEYDQAEINRIYRAATEDELGNERRDELVAINERCFADAGEGQDGSGS